MSYLSQIESDAILDQAEEHHQFESFSKQDEHQDYGPAISHIVKVNDQWYATSHREYATSIKFYPFCGDTL